MKKNLGAFFGSLHGNWKPESEILTITWEPLLVVVVEVVAVLFFGIFGDDGTTVARAIIIDVLVEDHDLRRLVLVFSIAPFDRHISVEVDLNCLNSPHSILVRFVGFDLL